VVPAADADDVVLVLTTIGANADTDLIARTLVEERLAACVNVLPPMTSFFQWQGAIERESERQLIIKTVGRRLEALRARLTGMHPYELPEFLVLPVAGGSPAYLAWLSDACS
jgi:periplasmic divalent cation tolerance protein